MSILQYVSVVKKSKDDQLCSSSVSLSIAKGEKS